ncbi:uncharacterized protein I303_106577 [Kwoniella dejecticola CBS 10117]|uniref:THO complex subunit 7 n=1 Tax=Kwoniella dejecticola CBS 10117 TaxID=1296121 RepID=A0A1A5ZUB5_9TREE|nr:uncharacterized protein I303_08166 [Kwoniella dejecticola CBS 10117]OBR81396.1 hypothetical protein I303_08166 [Kwoniella dejecticola CBS 10117]
MSAPFKEDALNRFRITHPDRDLKPLIRRLHRLPLLAATPDGSEVDVELERELVRMELLKWRSGIERILGSINNLERQTEIYKRQTQDTVNKTEQLRLTLAKEKEELERKRKLREHQVKCDEIAKRILARGKGRKELDDQISNLQSSLEDHKASHALCLQTTQARLDKFNQITDLIDECRSLKLPIEPASSIEDLPTDDQKMDVDISTASSPAIAGSSKLNLSALEFQPSVAPSVITTAPSTTKSAPSRSSSAQPISSNTNTSANTNTNTLKPPSSGHLLPSRPAQRSSSGGSTNTSTNGAPKLTRQGSNPGLPARPSALRSSPTPATLHGGSLEDGEVGPEEGEVASPNEESKKRARGNDSAASRNTRSRAK